jgi:hypothetical protein
MSLRGTATEFVEGDPLAIEVVGWISRERFHKEQQIHDFGRGAGPQPALRDGQLQSLDVLFTEIVKAEGR